MAIVIYNDNGTIKVVKFGTRVVSTDADPIVVQKQWVFLEGTIKPSLWESVEVVGLVESGYENAGCASPSVLLSALDSQYPASELSLGTKATIKMNEAGAGGQTCNSWAIFEVLEKQEEITATFDSNGGSPTYTSQSGYDSLDVTNPGTPTRDGYTFTGWSPALPQTITSDTTFVAQWEVDADPVEKEWVFLNGATNPGNVQTFENKGLFDSAYESQGCAEPSVLISALDPQYPASTLSIGTKAAIKMNGIGETCNTWAIFEVREA